MSNIQNNNIKEWYLTSFKTFAGKLNGHSKTFLHDIRENALKKLEELSFPTLKDEDWKYTNVSPILKENFIPAVSADKLVLTKADIEKYLFKKFDYYLAVFVNGIFSPELSDLNDLQDGLTVDSLANVSKNKPELIKEYFGKAIDINNAFVALNTAYSFDGIVITVAKGKIIEKPVQVLFINGSEKQNILSVPRNLVIAAENSQVKTIFNFAGVDGLPYFTNSITEAFTGDNAVVDIYKIQNENENAFHIEKTQAIQNRSSVFNHHSITFGGSIVRNDLNSVLNGEGIECHYYGIYLGKDKQHIDNHTFVDHAKPNCMSNELYKGILDDDSHGVFNGQIIVRRDAQKTNAFQSNKNVLLSDTAKIDTKPQLEIFADDVKCSHGATIGHLDDVAYFYIRSRGIPDELAKSMLINAFTDDVLETIKIEEMREQLNHLIFEHLHRIEIENK